MERLGAYKNGYEAAQEHGKQSLASVLLGLLACEEIERETALEIYAACFGFKAAQEALGTSGASAR